MSSVTQWTEQLPALVAQLPDTLGGHLLITVVPLAASVVISVPLAWLALRRPGWRVAVLTAVGVVQTIPGLALLALMVPVLAAVGGWLAPLGIDVPSLGLLPALLALTVYSLLPIVRNAVTGIEEVDAATVDAARAMGMTDTQVLRDVQLPLAAPVLLAGVRTAAVWVVGMATLATPVGQPSLGNYIFAGLQTRNATAVVFGCVAAAALAIALDGCLAAVEAGVRRRRRGWVVAGLGTMIGGIVVGLALPWLARPAAAGPVVVVGAKTFTEQYILAAALEQRLRGAGLSVRRLESLGSTVVFDALVAGEIDVYVDYTGTLWANNLGREDSLPATAVRTEVADWLHRTHGIDLLGSLGFENAYALAMRADHAQALGVRSLAELAAASETLTIGADYEFLQRPEWASVSEAYGLHFGRERTYDPSFLYEAVAAGEVDVISAYSSDGRIAAFDLLTLDDPRGALPPYEAVVLIAADANPAVAAALRPLLGAVPIDAMRRANLAVDRDNVPVERAAAELLEAALGSSQVEAVDP